MVQPLQGAIESTRAVLAKVKADQLGAATPCASWKVSDVINHIVGGQYFFAAATRGEEMPAGDPPDFAAGDYLAAFDDGSKAALAAFSEPGALERIIHLPFGDMSGSAWLGLASVDTFAHGWDVAKATGQSTDLAPELAAGLLQGARAGISDAFRGPEGKAPFGPVQEARADASNADQLAAFLGREA